MGDHDLAHDREADAGAGRFGREERHEDALQLSRRQARSIVRDRDRDPAARVEGRRQHDARVLGPRDRLERVLDQVDQRLVEQVRIGLDRQVRRLDRDAEFDAGAGRRRLHQGANPAERLTAPDGTIADIDAEIVPLVRALWRLGLATTSSCQDFGEGTAGQRNANPRPSWYGGDAFIAYYTGWAWLKMPVPDTLRLDNLMLGTDFHDRVTRRWQHGSWRMHIPVTFDEDHGIGPDSAAQIHLLKDQVPELTRTLERMTGVFG